MNTRIWCGACVVAAWWCVVAAGDCEVNIEGRNYTEDILVSQISEARGLAVDFITHYLYFSFYNITQGMFRTAKVDMRSKAFSLIEELSGICQFTVDQVQGEVHAGCRTDSGGTGGLHQWDSNTGQFEPTGETGRDVVMVHYYNDTLYYSADEGRLHTYIRGHSARVSAPAWQVRVFVGDALGDFIFSNYTGVYRRRRNGEEIQYRMFDRYPYSLAVDGRGNAYACHLYNPRGIWRLHDHARPTRLLDDFCGDLTFDGDGNVIYGDWSNSNILHQVQCET